MVLEVYFPEFLMSENNFCLDFFFFSLFSEMENQSFLLCFCLMLFCGLQSFNLKKKNIQGESILCCNVNKMDLKTVVRLCLLFNSSESFLSSTPDLPETFPRTA